RSLVVLKESPPYPPELEPHVLLNPLARASKDSTGSYAYPKQPDHLPSKYEDDLSVDGVGTDVEMITAVRHSDVFLKRNFTEQELAYCCQSPDFMASLAGGWAAKEAVFKALKTPSQGAGAAMKEIELLSGPSGPSVLLTGHASKIALERVSPSSSSPSLTPTRSPWPSSLPAVD
ncbi:hypothetical protein PCANC_25128, partial [Puccinia coronata f. sp. avenae]